MGAHRLYFYAPQRVAVHDFMGRLGAIITNDSPCGVDEAIQLKGLEHINFVVIDSHPRSLPQDMWDAIKTQGAIVIHVDDQWTRGRAQRRVVPITHYPGSRA